MPINITEEAIEKIPHSCLIKLQAIYDTLKTAEKKAADLLINDPDFFSSSTIVEAAERAGCSEATLVRLAKKLGFKGYPELKENLINKAKDNPVQLYEGLTEQDTIESITKKIFESSIQALRDTLNILNKENYKKAVECICRANKIVFCGVGDAFPVALAGCQKFTRIGLNAFVSSDFDLQLIYTSLLSPQDVVIAISHSGRTKTIIEVVKYAKSVGAKVIAITNYPISPLSKNSDITLLTASFVDNFNGEVISKRISELCILESLFMNVLWQLKDKLAENLNKCNLAVELNKL